MFFVFDIGGTNLRAAVFDPIANKLGEPRIVDTLNFFGQDDLRGAARNLIAALANAIVDLAEEADVRAIGVGFPGPVDAHGNLMAAPTIWGRQAQCRIPLKSMMAERWPDAAIEVVNDLTAAGHAFVAEDRRNFAIVTVGSGIGNKIFLDGRPVLGAGARGGELGHLVVDVSPDAMPCDCGGIGHLGGVASGRGALRNCMRLARDDPDGFRQSALSELCDGRPDRMTTEDIVAAFHQRDVWARNALATCTRPLAQTLASMHLAAGIEDFIIMGGFAQALGEAYCEMLSDLAAKSAWKNGFDWSRAIELVGIDDQPGLRGAAKLLLLQYG